jgi:hypothetical protein
MSLILIVFDLYVSCPKALFPLSSVVSPVLDYNDHLGRSLLYSLQCSPHSVELGVHVLVLLCWLGSLRHLEGVLSLVLSFELSALISVSRALLEPLSNIADQVLEFV